DDPVGSTRTPQTLNINGGSTVDIQAGVLHAGGDVFVGNGAGSAGTLRFSGAGATITNTTLTLNNGTVSTTAGTASLPTALVLVGTSNIFSAGSGSTLQVNAAVGGSGGVTIAGGGTVVYGA